MVVLPVILGHPSIEDIFTMLALTYVEDIIFVSMFLIQEFFYLESEYIIDIITLKNKMAYL